MFSPKTGNNLHITQVICVQELLNVQIPIGLGLLNLLIIHNLCVLCFITEVNVMWAGHQTHHSSEDYNFSTALRQSSIHRYLNWVN